MNEIVNKFLLAGDEIMPEMHLKQPGFTYSACCPFTRNKERIERFMQTGNTYFIYRNELDKACFQDDMVYDKSKDLTKRTQSDKVLRNKAFKIISDPKYYGYQRGLVSMVYTFFDKKSIGSVVVTEPNYQLANELHIQIIRKFKRRKVYSLFKKDKRGISIVNAFQKIISEERKSNKIWVDQGGEFYNKLCKRFLKINNIEMHSTYNQGKSVVAERLIRMLKNKIFKHMTAVLKSVYFDVLDDIVNKYKKYNKLINTAS